MNFLAHLLLSHQNDDIMIGNLIADDVRKTEWHQFSHQIIEGIKLHHKIDNYTDNNTIVELSKKRLRPLQGKYTPVVMDIVYDHFLAKNFDNFSNIPLAQFSQHCYTVFNNRKTELPNNTQHMLSFMIKHDWLTNYAQKEGLHQSLSGMGRRASFSNHMHQATEHIWEDYALYENEFSKFFPELQQYVNSQWPKNL